MEFRETVMEFREMYSDFHDVDIHSVSMRHGTISHARADDESCNTVFHVQKSDDELQ
jgi:hypothetical protein